MTKDQFDTLVTNSATSTDTAISLTLVPNMVKYLCSTFGVPGFWLANPIEIKATVTSRNVFTYTPSSISKKAKENTDHLYNYLTSRKISKNNDVWIFIVILIVIFILWMLYNTR